MAFVTLALRPLLHTGPNSTARLIFLWRCTCKSPTSAPKGRACIAAPYTRGTRQCPGACRYHPDKNSGDADAAAMFQKVRLPSRSAATGTFGEQHSPTHTVWRTAAAASHRAVAMCRCPQRRPSSQHPSCGASTSSAAWTPSTRRRCRRPASRCAPALRACTLTFRLPTAVRGPACHTRATARCQSRAPG